jgi:nicotinamidase-related amidase
MVSYSKGGLEKMSEWKLNGKPALVILHMQEGIVGSLLPEERAREVKESDHTPHQQALLKAFRAKNLPVIYVNVDNPINPPEVYPAYGVMFQNLSKQAEIKRSGDDNLKRLDVIPELTPLPGEPVLFNWLLGAFTHSGLEETLKARGVNTIVFFGGALHIAVFNATVQAVDLSYSVIVPQDACIPTLSATRTPETMKIREAFLEMFSRYALVTTADDVIVHLG